jgi:hypothetical protein
MQDLDPKLYPLAATPTPASLKNICFQFAGKPTLFTEAEDAHVTLKEVSLQTLFGTPIEVSNLKMSSCKKNTKGCVCPMGLFAQ